MVADGFREGESSEVVGLKSLVLSHYKISLVIKLERKLL